MAAEEGGEQRQAEKAKGCVEWFNDQKSSGFIIPTDGGTNLFVHRYGIKAGSGGFRSLGKGEAVEFGVEQGDGGRTKAANVTGPDEGPVQGENEQWTEGEEASKEAKAVRTS
nr:glycine-rich protein 2-like [Coffea arabica]